MPLPTIPGVVRYSVHGAVPGGQSWANVLHFRYSGGASSPGDSDLEALDAIAIRLWSGTAYTTGRAWFTNCTSAVTLTRVTIVRLDGTSLGVEIPKALAGTGTGTSLPPECAHVLTLRSAQRGRSRRGRIYLPCAITNAVDAVGKLTTGNRNDLITQADGVKAALGGAATAPFWEFGVASYKLSTFTPLALFTMDVDVDVQTRRRK